MKIIFLIAALLIVAFSANVNAQYKRVATYKDSSCAITPLFFDNYLKTDNCATSVVPVKCDASGSYYESVSCVNTVPTGDKNTLQVNVYSDNTCGTISSSQIFAIDTCIPSAGNSAMKTSGCKSLNLYSDSTCTTVKQTIDLTIKPTSECAGNVKYICNDSQMIGISALVMIIISSFLAILF